MENKVHVLCQALHGGEIVAVGLLELDPFREVLQVAADHVVAADHLVIAGDEGIGQVAAEKPCGSGDEDFQTRLQNTE